MVLFVVVLLLIFFSTLLVPGIKAWFRNARTSSRHRARIRVLPLRFLSMAAVLAVYASLAVLLTIFPLHAMEHLPFSESATVFSCLCAVSRQSACSFCLARPHGGISTVPDHHDARACERDMSVGSRIQSFGMHVLFFFLFGVLFALAYSFSIFHGASGSITVREGC